MSDKYRHTPALEAAPPVVGYETIERDKCASTVNLNSGFMRLGFFTARRTVTVTSVSVDSGTTAAGATPTLVRVGVYKVNADGGLTLIGSTVSDTTLLAATTTTYTKALQASVTFTDGQRYAVGPLVVTGAAVPNVAGLGLAQATAVRSPRIAAQVSGLSDLPSTVAVGSLSATGGVPYAVFT